MEKGDIDEEIEEVLGAKTPITKTIPSNETGFATDSGTDTHAPEDSSEGDGNDKGNHRTNLWKVLETFS